MQSEFGLKMTFVKKNVLNTLVNVALPQGATEGGLDQEFPTFSIPFLTWSWKGAWVTTGLFLSFLLAKTTTWLTFAHGLPFPVIKT